jgi:hypothetical protein
MTNNERASLLVSNLLICIFTCDAVVCPAGSYLSTSQCIACPSGMTALGGAISPGSCKSTSSINGGPTDSVLYFGIDSSEGLSAFVTTNSNLLSGPSWTTDRHGQTSSALILPLTTGYALTSTYLSVLPSSAIFSLSLWIRVPTNVAPTHDYHWIIGWGACRDSLNFHLILLKSGELTFYFQNSWASTSIFVFDGSWHHVVFSQDATTRIIYVDNVVRSSSSVIWSVPREFFVINSHCDVYGGDTQLHTQIDDVRVYARTLTSDEVSQTFLNIPTRSPSPSATSSSTGSTTVISTSSVSTTGSITTSSSPSSSSTGSTTESSTSSVSTTGSITTSSSPSSSSTGSTTVSGMIFVTFLTDVATLAGGLLAGILFIFICMLASVCLYQKKKKNVIVPLSTSPSAPSASSTSEADFNYENRNVTHHQGISKSSVEPRIISGAVNM